MSHNSHSTSRNRLESVLKIVHHDYDRFIKVYWSLGEWLRFKDQCLIFDWRRCSGGASVWGLEQRSFFDPDESEGDSSV